MTLELYLAFCVSALLLLALPGPTVMLVTACAANGGRRAGLCTVPGVVLGDLTAMSLSLAGLGAVMAASAALFTVLKWIGAAYLVWLGIAMWRRGKDPSFSSTPNAKGRGLFGRAYVVTALNPKSIAFFTAFMPQFVEPGSAALPQFALLGSTFIFLAGLNAAIYALLAGSLGGLLRRPGSHRLMSRAGGCVLVGAGLATAAMRRS